MMPDGYLASCLQPVGELLGRRECLFDKRRPHSNAPPYHNTLSWLPNVVVVNDAAVVLEHMAARNGQA
jgi:hypothetical protein